MVLLFILFFSGQNGPALSVLLLSFPSNREKNKIKVKLTAYRSNAMHALVFLIFSNLKWMLFWYNWFTLYLSLSFFLPSSFAFVGIFKVFWSYSLNIFSTGTFCETFEMKNINQFMVSSDFFIIYLRFVRMLYITFLPQHHIDFPPTGLRLMASL